MGAIVRTVAETVDLAVVEISDDYKVTLRQTPVPQSNTFTTSLSVDYTPDEAEQLAQELLEAASGVRAIQAADDRAEEATRHHAYAILGTEPETATSTPTWTALTAAHRSPSSLNVMPRGQRKPTKNRW